MIMPELEFSHLTDIVDYYACCFMDIKDFSLSDAQREQLQEVRCRLHDFCIAGQYEADMWLELCDELLN